MDSQGGEGRGGAGWALCAEVALVRGVSLLRIELRPAEENQEGLGPASNAAGRFCPHTRHERVPGGSAAQRGKKKKKTGGGRRRCGLGGSKRLWLGPHLDARSALWRKGIVVRSRGRSGGRVSDAVRRRGVAAHQKLTRTTFRLVDSSFFFFLLLLLTRSSLWCRRLVSDMGKFSRAITASSTFALRCNKTQTRGSRELQFEDRDASLELSK